MSDSSTKALRSWWSEVQTLLNLNQESDWRELHESELNRLRGFGNGSEDWNRIRVREGFQPERFKSNVFSGDCFSRSKFLSFEKKVYLAQSAQRSPR